MGKVKIIDFELAKQNDTILKGFVRECRKIPKPNEEFTEELYVDCGGTGIIIEEKEVDIFPFQKSIRHLVGEEVNFCVLEVFAGNVIYGSIKKAYQIKTAPIKEKLKRGEVLEGTITNCTEYGAYIDVSGVKGFLRNTDFSDDGTEVRQVYKRYSKIRVKYMSHTKKGHILLVPEKKVEGISAITGERISEGSTYSAKVIRILERGVIVVIAPKVKALCYPPKHGTVRVNDMVAVRISQAYADARGVYKIKGVVTKVISQPKLED